MVTGGKTAAATGSKIFKTVTKVAASGKAADKVKVGIKNAMSSSEKKKYLKKKVSKYQIPNYLNKNKGPPPREDEDLAKGIFINKE